MSGLVLGTDVACYLYGNLPEADAFEPHLRDANVVLTFVTVAEMYSAAHRNDWGPARFRHLDAFIQRYLVLSSDARVIRRYARLAAHAARTKHPLARATGGNDLWIAACATARRMPILTGDAADFRGLPGLEVLGPAE